MREKKVPLAQNVLRCKKNKTEQKHSETDQCLNSRTKSKTWIMFHLQMYVLSYQRVDYYMTV